MRNKAAIVIIVWLVLLPVFSKFIAHPSSSTIKITFIDEDSENPVVGVFLMKSGNKWLYVKTNNRGEIIVNKNSLIYGPRISPKPYFPIKIIALKNTTIKLKKAYFIVMKKYLALYNPYEKIEKISPIGAISFEVSNMRFGYKSDARCLGLNSSTVLVPVSGDIILIKINNFILSINVTQANWGDYVELDLREVSCKYNKIFLDNAIAKLKEQMSILERKGIYMGFCKTLFGQLIELKDKAEEFYKRGNWEEALVAYKKAFLIYGDIVNRINVLSTRSTSTVPTISLVLVFLSYFLASFITDKKFKKILLYSCIYFILLLIIFAVYPILLEGNPYLTISPLFIYLFSLIIFILSEKIPDHYIREGFSFAAATSASLSIVLRENRRRKLRLTLTLLTIALVAFAAHTLNTLTIIQWSYEKEVAYVSSAYNGSILVTKFKESVFPYYSLSIVFVRTISNIDSPQIICIKRESSPYSKEFKISYGEKEVYALGAISFTSEVKYFLPLKEAVIEGKIPSQESEVLLSQTMASALGAKCGDKVSINGIEATVVGIFDEDKLSEIRDLDGGKILPVMITQEEGSWRLEVIPAKYTIICSELLGERLKLPRYKIYVKVLGNPEDYARKAAILTDSWVFVNMGGKVKYYTVSTVIVVKGESLIIPIVIVLLTVFVSIMENVYERKREISILASLGLNPSNIAYLFSLEGAVLGFVGSALGMFAGFIAFKAFSLAEVLVPVDFKLSPVKLLFTVVAATLVSITASFPPALKASVMVTPSLERRWKLEEQKDFIERGLTQTLPIRIPANRVEDFVNYVVSKFRELSTGLLQKVDLISVEKIGEEYRILFKYYKGSDISYKSCFTENTLILYKISDNVYGAKATSKPVTQHSKLGLYYVHETLSFLRKIALEWSSRATRILVALGENPAVLYTIVKKYDPYEVIVLTTPERIETVSNAKKILVKEKIRVPAIRVYSLSSLSELFKLKEDLRILLSEVQYIAVGYDSGLAGVILTILSSKAGKKILLIEDKRSKTKKEERSFAKLEVTEVSPSELKRIFGYRESLE